MSIQVMPGGTCYVCGVTYKEKAHVCAWEAHLATLDAATHPGADHVRNYIRSLILDAYHRGFKDGGKGLTRNQTLNLQNAFTSLGHIRSEIRELLFPEKPNAE